MTDPEGNLPDSGHLSAAVAAGMTHLFSPYNLLTLGDFVSPRRVRCAF